MFDCFNTFTPVTFYNFIFMAVTGPIIIIEDDEDDIHIMEEVFKSMALPNTVLYFKDCEKVYAYLKTTRDKPFLIFSDINLPGMSGMELKEKINKDDEIRRKSIPFVFLTTTSNHNIVLESYELLSQGFFTKPDTIASIKNMMEMIFNYWKIAQHPNPSLL